MSDPVTAADLQRQIAKLQGDNEGLTSSLRALESERDELKALLEKDPTTGLPIKRLFDREYERLATRHASVDHGSLIAIGLLRLDSSYMRIRNTRDRSRALIFTTAQRIQQFTGEHLYQSDRLDEFLFLLTGIRNATDAERIAQQITDAVAQPHAPPAQDVAFGCYIGITLFPDHGENRDELVDQADIALTESRAEGRRFALYDAQMGARFREQMQIDDALRGTSRTGFEDFRMVYQPFVGQDGVMNGCEALIRWQHPTLGAISPAQFIPLAEQNGTIRFISQWTLYQSLRQLTRWRERSDAEVYVSVNLAAVEFGQPDLVDRISGILDSLELEGRHLKLELTEGMIMDDRDEAMGRMQRLRDMGIQLSIDDFGTGYSSLAYLKHLPIDMLKIDRSFIIDVEENTSNQEIVKAIIAMARSINVTTLAEGVENERQVQFLMDQGCDYIQGYYYSKPVPPETISDYLAADGRLPLQTEA